MSVKGINIKDKLVQQVAADLQHPEEVVEKVVNHQFKHAASQMPFNNQVEISGFGTFERSKAKTRKRQERLNKIKENILNKPDVQSARHQKRLEAINHELNNYYK